MKKYIGTKTIMAEPMTMGEAYDNNLLGCEIWSLEFDNETKGYYVEYDDGCKSWSPAELFERTYKIAETPLDRMRFKQEEEFEHYKDGLISIKSQTFSKLNYLPKVLLSALTESQRECCSLFTSRISYLSHETVTLNGFDFGTAVKFLKAGGVVRRSGWSNKEIFIIKQDPTYITEDIIPNMQSLPQIAKNILMARENPHVFYANQMLVIYPDSLAISWAPSQSDIFANDWELVTE